MPLPTSLPSASRRPAGPRCRGGVSSLLRLAQPAAGGLGHWIAAARPARIVIRLLPSATAAAAQHASAAHASAPYRFPDR